MTIGYNPFSCSGWAVRTIGGPCTMARIGIVLLFFIVALARKWVGREMGLPFNEIGGWGGTFALYLIVLFFTGSVKWSFVFGIIGLVVGGFLIGYFTGGEDDYGYE
jgi:hypothetical protein